MPTYIGKIDGRYFEFSTVVDAPVTELMTKQEFEAYYRDEHGRSSMHELAKRMERVESKGTSSLEHESLEDMIQFNRWGHDEECVPVDEFKAELIRQTEEVGG